MTRRARFWDCEAQGVCLKGWVKGFARVSTRLLADFARDLELQSPKPNPKAPCTFIVDT